jgi:hypothetical protein
MEDTLLETVAPLVADEIAVGALGFCTGTDVVEICTGRIHCALASAKYVLVSCSMEIGELLVGLIGDVGGMSEVGSDGGCHLDDSLAFGSMGGPNAAAKSASFIL